MTTIQTQTYVGPDGVLKLELPVEERDRQVQVVVVVQAKETSMDQAHRSGTPAAGSSDQMARLAAAGMGVPERREWLPRSVPPLPTQGKLASESLVEDRR